MALSAATRLLGPCRAPVQGSLLLLLLPLGLGWTQPPRAAETGQGRRGRQVRAGEELGQGRDLEGGEGSSWAFPWMEASAHPVLKALIGKGVAGPCISKPCSQGPGLLDLAGVRDPVSLAPGLSGFSCVEASRLSARQVLELLVTARQNSALRVDQVGGSPSCGAAGVGRHSQGCPLCAVWQAGCLSTSPLRTWTLFPSSSELHARSWLGAQGLVGSARVGLGRGVGHGRRLPLQLFLHSPATFPGPRPCASFLSWGSKASIPPGAPERQSLLLAALACLGVRGSQLSKADVRALGSLACDLPGHFVANAATVLLPQLAGCPGPLDQDQKEAARTALRGAGSPYGPPSRWSVSTLEALWGLLAKLDPPIVRSIPQRSSRHPSWRRLEPDARLPRFRRDTEKACPPGQEPEVVDENLFWYEDRELEACVEGAMLAEQMDNVNRVPFTYQQLSIFKRKLDQTFPQGYPESLVQKLGPFFRYVLPEDINKWNVTSLGTVKDLLQASRGHSTDAQVMALLTRYLLRRGDLDKDTLDFLAGVPPTYLCVLSSRQLESLPLSILWTVTPKDLDSCSPRQLGLLYPKAHLAFQNVSGQEYLGKIKPFLGGASTEDLQALGHQNVSMDLATFKQLRVESVVPLTVAEVQRLLGLNVADLKGEESSRPVRDWIFHQRQEDLDQLGLGLQGGVPNGYLILDLGFREAFTGGAPRPRPGLGLAWISTPLLVFMLS
ncbi:LOW QUALITY PROTEIN: mesothelin-like [Thomomys bottae]